MDTSSARSEITVLLRAWKNGDREALGKLTPFVYKELYCTAQRCMARQRPGHILQSTALVNETYAHLAKMREVDWQDRGHFFAVCAQLMRRILTDYARSQLYLKRGGEIKHVPFDENLPVPDRNFRADLIALDDALHDLAAFDERMSQIVQLRVFVGLNVEETAEALSVSERTVKREWKSAKVWLLRELDRGKNHGE